MDFVIVQYAPFVVAVAAFGFVVGWWAQGSARRGKRIEAEPRS